MLLLEFVKNRLFENGLLMVLYFAILVFLLAFFIPSSYANIKHTPINGDEYNLKCLQEGSNAWMEMRRGAKERALLC